MSYFRQNFLDNSCIVNNVHELFENVSRIYGQDLENSIRDLYLKGTLKEKNTNKYYNYLILDAGKLYKLMERFDTNELCLREVQNTNLSDFKKCIIYIGKGCGERKYIHLREAEDLMNGHLCKKKSSAKYTKIA